MLCEFHLPFFKKGKEIQKWEEEDQRVSPDFSTY